MAYEKFRCLTAVCTFTGIGRLKDQQKFCDLTISVKGKTFSCHRVVLASVSKFFETCLLSMIGENSLAHVQVDHEDVSHTTFQSLLEILYKGKNVITQDSVQDFLKMSIYLQIHFLTRYCEEFIRKYLQPKDCLGLWQFAQRYKLSNLAESCSRCAAENIDTLSEDELLALPKSMLFILLSLQNKLSMDDVCKTILRWVESDKDTRSGVLTQFIPFISFPLLSRDYLADLIEYRDHPFSEHVKDSIILALKTSDDKNVQTRLKIMCQQSITLNSTDIIPVSVVIKATNLPLDNGPTLEAWCDMEQRYVLAPVPENIGCHFATCTWRNEIYLSGGTLMPTFFAVYTPGDNKWSVLPALDADGGREKHAMAAVNDNIYVLGGLTKRSGDTKVMTFAVVQRYEISSKKWNFVCHLPVAVQETSTAVVGHRIYLFGGVDAAGVNLDLVQCVDTVNSDAYVAGMLPSCTCGTRALSNKGTIWVVLRSGQVLQMWEDFHMADKKEKYLAITKNKIFKDKPMPGNKTWTVAFREISKISIQEHVAACISNSEITVIGTQASTHGCLICDVHIIDLTTGQVQEKTTCLNNAHSFDLQTINIPLMHLQKKASVLDVTNVSSRSSDTDSLHSSSSINSPVSRTIPHVNLKSQHEKLLKIKEQMRRLTVSMLQLTTPPHIQERMSRDQVEVPTQSTSMKSLPVTTYINLLDNEEQGSRTDSCMDNRSTSDSSQCTSVSRKRTHAETGSEDEDYLTSSPHKASSPQTDMLLLLETSYPLKRFLLAIGEEGRQSSKKARSCSNQV